MDDIDKFTMSSAARRSAVRRSVSKPVQKLREQEDGGNNQKEINLESMSFSCDAGLGANEDHSFFDTKAMAPQIPR